ncbi:hypothetical protein GCM10027577_29890 [Spirosoma fluminis]
MKPANRLQEYVLTFIKKVDNVLLNDPELLLKSVELYVKQACRAYPRCTKQEASPNRDYKTKELRSIGINGLVTLSILKVAGEFIPHPDAIPTPAPATAPPPDVAPYLPRQAIQKSREDDTIVKFVYWEKFPVSIRVLLQEGKIWAMYENVLGQITAEEYGGKTHSIL